MCQGCSSYQILAQRMKPLTNSSMNMNTDSREDLRTELHISRKLLRTSHPLDRPQPASQTCSPIDESIYSSYTSSRTEHYEVLGCLSRHQCVCTYVSASAYSHLRCPLPWHRSARVWHLALCGGTPAPISVLGTRPGCLPVCLDGLWSRQLSFPMFLSLSLSPSSEDICAQVLSPAYGDLIILVCVLRVRKMSIERKGFTM